MSRTPVDKIIEVLDATPKKFAGHIQEAAQRTEDNFGNVRVFFNPIYLSNLCSNDCIYCGFRRSNSQIRRRTLEPEEAVKEAIALISRGVRHILLLAGEYNKDVYVHMLTQNLKTIRKFVSASWLGIEIASLSENEYRQLAEAGADSVVVFQETYDRARYAYLHRYGGPKTDFDYRLSALSRAAKSGFREVGLGVLYGVGEWRSDTLAMAEHAAALLQKDHSLKLRFSFPRLKACKGQEREALSETIDEALLFKIIVAVRIAFPCASLVLTGRESASFLLRCLAIINVIGKQGSTAVGGYSVCPELNQLQQFTLDSDLTLNQIREKVMSTGYLPI